MRIIVNCETNEVEVDESDQEPIEGYAELLATGLGRRAAYEDLDPKVKDALIHLGLASHVGVREDEGDAEAR